MEETLLSGAGSGDGVGKGEGARAGAGEIELEGVENKVARRTERRLYAESPVGKVTT